MALGFLNAKKMPLRAHENILVFYRALPTYNPQMTVGEPYIKRASFTKRVIYNRETPRTETNNKGTRYPRSVQKWAQDQHRGHPAAKPKAMFERLIQTYTHLRETVLDNCMGGGARGYRAAVDRD